MQALNTFRPQHWLGTALALGGLLLAAAPARAADVDVGVSIGINQPGLYGRIDIGRFPQPQLIVQRPVVIYQQTQMPPPIYLHVPPGHRKNWRKHCSAYNACGAPVYFVQERWYQDTVVRGDRGDRRDDRSDDRQGDRGHGNGKGKGHGHGRGHD